MVLLQFALGLVALVLGAELLVRGSGRLALTLGLSPLVVGLTIVAMGTSAPEVAVSVGSALHGHPQLAVGNVVGSNVFNVLFILGLSALILPLRVDAQIVRQEVPVMVGASLLLAYQAQDGEIGRGEAAILLALLAAYTTYLVRQGLRAQPAVREVAEDVAARARWDDHWGVQVALVVGGLLLLVVGARELVQSASTFARSLGLSELVIGLTIVAAGTSLPEVATSITAAFRGQRDIAIGNVVGSNIFNVLGCLGATGVVTDGGLPIGADVLAFDLWVMLAVAVACVPVFWTGREIARWEGALFLCYYGAYTGFLVLAATTGRPLPDVRVTVLTLFATLAAASLVVSALPTRRSPEDPSTDS